MECCICGQNINAKHQDGVSPISGYPVCEDCVQDLCCQDCGSTENLHYVEDYDLVLCASCISKAENEEV